MTKNTISWKFLRKLSKSFKNYLKNMLKCIILAYFSKDLTNHSLTFCAFGRKTQILGTFWEKFENLWWKFYRKIEFLFFIFILENLLLKIEPSEIAPFFYNIFWFRGVEFFPLSPLATPLRDTESSGQIFFLQFHQLLESSHIRYLIG